MTNLILFTEIDQKFIIKLKLKQYYQMEKKPSQRLVTFDLLICF